jgi:pimeloyl-ACP methyl ester carboxylesterase
MIGMTVATRRRRADVQVPERFYAGGSGEPLVLLHGFTDTWQGWTRLLPLLTPHHAVFAPTLPGHFGGEQFPPGVAPTTEASLDLVEKQLAARGIDRAHFVGNSLGGWAALELAVRGRALSVVALCPAGGWYPGTREERQTLRFFKRMHRMAPMASLVGPYAVRVPALRRTFLREVVARPGNVTADEARMMFEGSAGCSIVREGIAMAETGQFFSDLGEIDCPVRILYGTEDRLVRWPRQYERMKKLLPDVEYLPLEGLGHLPMWDDPQLVARRILEVTCPSA